MAAVRIWAVFLPMESSYGFREGTTGRCMFSILATAICWQGFPSARDRTDYVYIHNPGAIPLATQEFFAERQAKGLLHPTKQ